MKYEKVYIKVYEDVTDARRSLGDYFVFYNSQRRHQSLDEQTPDTVYFEYAARMAA